MIHIVLKLLLTGAILLLMSIGIMMIGASLLLFLISTLAFPSLRKFLPDTGSFVDLIGRALRVILFDKNEENELRNRDADFSGESSDTRYHQPRAYGRYETVIPKSRATCTCMFAKHPAPAPHLAPGPSAPKPPAPETEKPEEKKPEEKKPEEKIPDPWPMRPQPNSYNKIITFDVTDQTGDSD